MYTGLVSWHERDYQERPGQECLQYQCVRRLMTEQWICRLLAHSVAGAPAVRLRRAEATLSERTKEQMQQRRKKKNPGKGRGVAVFP
ncbi:TPA_asm: hypothetical protein G0B47_25515 [Salmonella enterica subsp. salamae serovar 48:d:z6]|uniref:Uncharacterized protein n=1 Tax=Salmonella enterica subsp. salamae serovar 48:d:z6 TaxID=1151170 RepID=A0A701VBC4_SALER|nr:hypothetical protein [Salmonella enterica subsp. salamae serovar 48:d:z6]